MATQPDKFELLSAAELRDMDAVFADILARRYPGTRWKAVEPGEEPKGPVWYVVPPEERPALLERLRKALGEEPATEETN